MVAQHERPQAGVVVYVPVEDITPNPWQVQAGRRFQPEVIRQLADSIRREGLLQPPLARPSPMFADGKVQLAFGHRRTAAIRLLIEEGAWPHEGVPVQVRELTDSAMVIIALTENIERSDVTPVEQYRAVKKALAEVKGLTVEAMAKTMGVDASTLGHYLRVLELPQLILVHVADGEMSLRAAREFLCLVSLRPDGGVDHMHEDIMQEVEESLASFRLGSPPDYRTRSVRQRIAEKLEAHRASEWRKLGPVPKHGRVGGTHNAYAPLFNVEAFKAEHPLHVHAVPCDDTDGQNRVVEGSVAFTCDVHAWGREQDRAKAAGEKRKGKGLAKGAGEKAAVQAVLDQDPLAKKMAAGKTPAAAVAQRIVEQAKAENEPVPPVLTGNRPDAPTEAEADAQVQKRIGWRVLNEQLGKDCLAAQESGAALQRVRKSGMALFEDLKLAGYGLAMDAVMAATARFVDTFEEKLVSAKKARMSDEERLKALGTRGLPPLKNVGAAPFHIDLGEHAYDAPPAYFPDLRECRELCTWGARYAHYGGGLRLFCTNQEHYREKLQRGLAAYEEKYQAAMAAHNAGEAGLVREVAADLEAMPGPGARAVLAALLRVMEFKPTRFGDHREWDDRDRFSFWTDAQKAAAGTLGIKLGEDKRRLEIAGASAVSKALALGDADARSTVAQLTGSILAAAGIEWPGAAPVAGKKAAPPKRPAKRGRAARVPVAVPDVDADGEELGQMDEGDEEGEE